MRQQKQKLSRQVRDKEEELDASLQKIDTLRQDIRKAEKLRRELQLRSEDALNEATKERKLREKAEVHSRQLEKDLGGTSSKGLASPLEAGGVGDPAEVVRLREEMERMEVTTQETLLSQQSKHGAELSSMREQLEEAERRSCAFEMDVQNTREKLDRARLDSLQVHQLSTVSTFNGEKSYLFHHLTCFLFHPFQESEEMMKELRMVHEREKLLLVEENKKLQSELERAAELSGRMQLERRQLEEEYAELRGKKEAIAHWETQISEIINWVSDEKDARGYLQALAGKMTEELEFLKHTGAAQAAAAAQAQQQQMPAAEKNWKNRRSQKLEKMELLNLQSNLQSEIHAKQAINEELSIVRSELESSRK